MFLFKREMYPLLAVTIILCLGTTIFRLSGGQRADEQAHAATRPNIILILTDDLDKDLITVMPNLKSLLVQQGISFKNAIVSNSLCCPSRATILCGQYAHNTTIKTNSPGFIKFYNLGLESTTIAKTLQSTGYYTALVGKYLNGYGYPSKVPKTYIPPGWTEWYSVADGGLYVQYNYTLNENGTLVNYGRTAQDYQTDVFFKKARSVITTAKNTRKPFFLYLSIVSPHGPATPAPRHVGSFSGFKAPRPPSFNEADVSDKPAFIRSRRLLTADDEIFIDNFYRNRLRSLLAVDEGIQAVYQLLSQTSQVDNTYIFFFSDNGHHLGQHRFRDGKQLAYEEDINVPFIVRGPNVPRGKTLEHLVANIDLFPTFANLANVAIPSRVDGRSLVPLFSNSPPTLVSWRKAVLLEHWSEYQSVFKASSGVIEPPDSDQKRGRAPVNVPDYFGLRSRLFTYAEYKTGDKELYHLENDPYQLNNIAGSNPQLVRTFSDRVAELKQCKGATCRSIENKPFPVGIGIRK